MLTLVRHLFAVAVLPFTVAVLIPLWIARQYHVAVVVGANALELVTQLVGIAFVAIGLLLFGESLRHFVVKGHGTLAPWDPPKHLVVDGPYRYVRNPMISGVLFVLFGEALVLLSWPHARWALLFLCINLIYIPLLEEPLLQARFGDSYRNYRHHVRRFIPRLRPWPPRDRGNDN
ncbi:MAG TPA: isoprenylcysteine carboxylmethyltransferase family protein [Acidobacteriota bacterium]|jgi:protein-S-isoprenylcysteine O-methyltransferase Ste14